MFAVSAAYGAVTRYSQIYDAAEDTDVDLHGVVTYVFPDEKDGFVIADTLHYERTGVLVRPEENGQIEGAFALQVGETVVVRGKTVKDHGIVVICGSHLLRTGRMEMAPPPLKISDFRKGWRHLRRNYIEGYVVSCVDEPRADGGTNSVLWLRVPGTRGFVPVHVRGELSGDVTEPETVVAANGLVINTYDENGVPLSSVLDVAASRDVRVVDSSVVDVSRAWRRTAIGAGIVIGIIVVAFGIVWLRIMRERANERLLASDRRRIADDLHDNIQQLIAAAMFRLDAASGAMGEPAVASVQIAGARKALESTLAGLRSILWGLQEAQETPDSLVGLFKYAASRMPHWEGIVEIVSQGSEPQGFRRHGGRLLMIMQEAVGNALNHGRASKVVVRLAFVGGFFKMTVRDDGCGFDPLSAGSGGIGLASMRRRAGEIGGVFDVKSEPGKGTIVKVEVKT